MNDCINVKMDRWMDGWMDGWMWGFGWINKHSR